MAQFEYKPIDLEGHSFRLFRIFQGDCGLIEGELFDAWLQGKDNPIDYEALSYTWEGNNKSHEIIVNGRVMPVTSNLSRALQQLRYRHQDRIIWIDAICIDQSNAKERGHQVHHMTDIYKRAEQVVIWLGQATSETDIIFDHMGRMERELNKHASSMWNDSNLQQRLWLESGHSSSSNADRYSTTREQNGLRALLCRGWFTRVWIIQEVANARSAKVLCGKKWVSARIFAITAPLINVTPDPHCQAVLDIMPGVSRQQSWFSQSRDLHTLLRKFRRSKATDPRDLVYALLGISSDGPTTLVPNYEKTVEEVIYDTVVFLLHLDKEKCCIPQGHGIEWTMLDFMRNLEILSYATMNWAAKSGHEEMVRLLLAENAHVNTSLEEPLALAAKQGHEAIVKLLLETRKPDINYRYFGHTLLSSAVVKEQMAMVKLLLGENADVNTTIYGGHTPLSLAVKGGHEAIVKLLLDTNKADVLWRDIDDHTLIFLAAEKGFEAIVKLLLAKNARVDSKDRMGSTPLYVAVKNGHEATVKLLLDAPNTDLASSEMNHHVLLYHAVNHGHEAIAKLLLDKLKADTNTQGVSPETLLSLAIYKEHEAIVKLLLNTQKIDINIKDESDTTPLLRAARDGKENIVKLLLETGMAQINIRDKYGRTPLFAAVYGGHEGVVKLLLETGNANTDIKDEYGRTPWTIAVQHRQKTILELLR